MADRYYICCLTPYSMCVVSGKSHGKAASGEQEGKRKGGVRKEGWSLPVSCGYPYWANKYDRGHVFWLWGVAGCMWTKEKLRDTGRRKTNICSWYWAAKTIYADHTGRIRRGQWAEQQLRRGTVSRHGGSAYILLNLRLASVFAIKLWKILEDLVRQFESKKVCSL